MSSQCRTGNRASVALVGPKAHFQHGGDMPGVSAKVPWSGKTEVILNVTCRGAAGSDADYGLPQITASSFALQHRHTNTGGKPTLMNRGWRPDSHPKLSRSSAYAASACRYATARSGSGITLASRALPINSAVRTATASAAASSTVSAA